MVTYGIYIVTYGIHVVTYAYSFSIKVFISIQVRNFKSGECWGQEPLALKPGSSRHSVVLSGHLPRWLGFGLGLH